MKRVEVKKHSRSWPTTAKPRKAKKSGKKKGGGKMPKLGQTKLF